MYIYILRRATHVFFFFFCSVCLTQQSVRCPDPIIYSTLSVHYYAFSKVGHSGNMQQATGLVAALSAAMCWG